MITQRASQLLREDAAVPPVVWLEGVLRWLFSVRGEERGVRLRALETALRNDGPALERLQQALQSISAVRLLAETGLSDLPSPWEEAGRRLLDRVVPRRHRCEGLAVLLSRLQLKTADAQWLRALPEERTAFWKPLMTLPPAAARAAILLVAHRAAGLALSPAVLELNPEPCASTSPFLDLPHSVAAWADQPGNAEAQQAFERSIAECLRHLHNAHRQLEKEGLSSDLVFQLDLIEKQVLRCRDLLRLNAGRGDAQAFAAELVEGSVRQRNAREAVNHAVQRLTRKVVEHAGRDGHHYIASGWKERFASGAGGGLVTGFTAIFKGLIRQMGIAPGLAGGLTWLNYSGSFILMQLAAFSLASKQPAFTATALARNLDEAPNGQAVENEVEYIAALCRSQVSVTLGNVLAAVPASVTLAMLWVSITGEPAVPVQEALHTVNEMNPAESASLFAFSALTGVSLWISSLVNGWAANWCSYRDLPRAIEERSWVKTRFGPAAARRTGHFVGKHWPAMASYVVLGFLLGFVPSLAQFAGIPLEARHVTLQAGALAIAGQVLWSAGELTPGMLAWGTAGVAVIAVCNFGVSFVLALWTALRAEGTSTRARWDLWKRLRQEVVRRPGRFVWVSRTA